jgi:hypothetical protein
LPGVLKPSGDPDLGRALEIDSDPLRMDVRQELPDLRQLRHDDERIERTSDTASILSDAVDMLALVGAEGFEPPASAL